VLHDWGSAIGFHRAARFPHQIKAIAFMESILMGRTWDDFDPGAAQIFKALRTIKGEEMVLGGNIFVDHLRCDTPTRSATGRNRCRTNLSGTTCRTLAFYLLSS
jgi:hypothetical protein